MKKTIYINNYKYIYICVCVCMFLSEDATPKAWKGHSLVGKERKSDPDPGAL